LHYPTFHSKIYSHSNPIFIGNYDVGNAGWLHGLMIVAVALLAQAVWGARGFR